MNCTCGTHDDGHQYENEAYLDRPRMQTHHDSINTVIRLRPGMWLIYASLPLHARTTLYGSDDGKGSLRRPYAVALGGREGSLAGEGSSW